MVQLFVALALGEASQSSRDDVKYSGSCAGVIWKHHFIKGGLSIHHMGSQGESGGGMSEYASRKKFFIDSTSEG